MILSANPEWGLGQIQCVVGTRVTVNFEHAGKKLINIAHAELKSVRPDEHNEPEHS